MIECIAPNWVGTIINLVTLDELVIIVSWLINKGIIICSDII